MKALHALQLTIVAVAAIVLSSQTLATPDCTDKRVLRMAERGETIAAIAEKCELDEEDVEEILDAAPTPQDPPVNGPGTQHTQPRQTNLLGPGEPVGECGCWGFVAPGYQQPHPRCQSGVAVAQMCSSMCAAGGYAWQGVCR